MIDHCNPFSELESPEEIRGNHSTPINITDEVSCGH